MSNKEALNLERQIRLLQLSLFRDLHRAKFIAWKLSVVKEAAGG